MPFDLPPKARSAALASSWQKALNYRDFQDKLLRVIQYGSRGTAFYLLRADPTHVLGTKLFNLCACSLPPILALSLALAACVLRRPACAGTRGCRCLARRSAACALLPTCSRRQGRPRPSARSR